MTNTSNIDSEPGIDLLTISIIKEKGKDKPGCQKVNIVELPLNSNKLFSCDDIECTSTKQDDGYDITEIYSTNI